MSDKKAITSGDDVDGLDQEAVLALAKELCEKHGALSCEIILEFGDEDNRDSNELAHHYFGPDDDGDDGEPVEEVAGNEGADAEGDQEEPKAA